MQLPSISGLWDVAVLTIFDIIYFSDANVERGNHLQFTEVQQGSEQCVDKLFKMRADGTFSFYLFYYYYNTHSIIFFRRIWLRSREKKQKKPRFSTIT